MLSKEYRLRLVEIACRIRLGREVCLSDMVWYNKLLGHNKQARGIHERFTYQGTSSPCSRRYCKA